MSSIEEEYRKAYQREKRYREAIEQIFHKKIEELTAQNTQLLGENEHYKQLESFEANFPENFDLTSENPYPIIKLDLNLNVVYANTSGYQIIIEYNGNPNTFNILTPDQFNFLRKELHFSKKLHLKKRIFELNINLSKNSEILIFATDITEKAEVEYKLAETENTYKTLFKTANVIVYKVNLEGNFTLINNKTIEIVEYSELELLNMNFINLVHPDSRRTVLLHYLKLIRSRTKSSYLEFRLLTKSGKSIWVGQSVTLKFMGNEFTEAIAVARDITEVKINEIALKNSEEKYRKTIENLHFGLMEVDTNEHIQKVNNAMIDLTGYTEEELIGKQPFQFLLTDESKRVMEEQITNRSKGNSNAYEVQLKRKDGALRWAMISGTPIYDENNIMIGSLGIHVDITDQKETVSNLRIAENKALESLKSKEIFLAKMSHELRTPLNAILGFSEIIQNNYPDNVELKNQINPVYTSAQHLLNLVNDLLDFTKLNQSKIKLEKIGFDICKLSKEVENLFKQPANQKNIQLIFNLPENSPFVSGDPTRIRQIITNLVSNSIKFTQDGYVKFHLSYESKGDQVVTKIMVEDSGIGIKPENLERIFKEFEQEDIGTTRNFGGTGLGLPIVKGLVDAMNGSIKIRSEFGSGTTVELIIPLHKATTPSEKTVSEEINDPNQLHGHKVLVVDDHPFNLMLAQNMLEAFNAVPTVVSSGIEAIDRIEENFDVVLMDIEMPEMNGIETTEIIKRTTPNLPVIAVTADLVGGHAAKKDLFSGFLAKPYSAVELYNIIAKVTLQ